MEKEYLSNIYNSIDENVGKKFLDNNTIIIILKTICRVEVRVDKDDEIIMSIPRQYKSIILKDINDLNEKLNRISNQLEKYINFIKDVFDYIDDDLNLFKLNINLNDYTLYIKSENNIISISIEVDPYLDNHFIAIIKKDGIQPNITYVNSVNIEDFIDLLSFFMN